MEKKTNDQYINEMYDAATASKKESLTQSYQQAVSGLDQSRDAAKKRTEEALTATAVESQRAGKNFAEVQNGQGLTSGAVAQARLARDNQTQANMTDIRNAQATTEAGIEAQKNLLAQQYQSAIAQAQADGDLQKAQALFDEAKAADEKLLAQQQTAAQAMANAGDYSLFGQLYGLSPEQIAALQKQHADAKAQPNQQAAAQAMASAGDFSLLGKLYGLSPEQIATLQKQYSESKDLPNQQAAAQLMASVGDYSLLGQLYGLTPEQIQKLTPTPTYAPAAPVDNHPNVSQGRKYVIADWIGKQVDYAMATGNANPVAMVRNSILGDQAAGKLQTDDEIAYAMSVLAQITG